MNGRSGRRGRQAAPVSIEEKIYRGSCIKYDEGNRGFLWGLGNILGIY